MRKKYPEVRLIPTADILFTKISHIVRTKAYYEDDKFTSVNPLLLCDGELNLYVESIKGTSHLWEKEYHCPYLGKDFHITDWEYWDNTKKSARFYKKEPTFKPPPAYLAVIGPPPPLEDNFSGISISLTSQDLNNDLKWLPELERNLANMVEDCEQWGIFSSEKNVFSRLVTSYVRFLYLVAKYPEQRMDLAPPVTIDLMWHAHMTMTDKYRKDTERALGGSPLHHVPWKNSNEVEYLSSTSPFICLWKKEFNTTIEKDHIFGDFKFDDEDY